VAPLRLASVHTLPSSSNRHTGYSA
jgi:hypothetical protein